MTTCAQPGVRMLEKRLSAAPSSRQHSISRIRTLERPSIRLGCRSSPPHLVHREPGPQSSRSHERRLQRASPPRYSGRPRPRASAVSESAGLRPTTSPLRRTSRRLVLLITRVGKRAAACFPWRRIGTLRHPTAAAHCTHPIQRRLERCLWPPSRRFLALPAPFYSVEPHRSRLLLIVRLRAAMLIPRSRSLSPQRWAVACLDGASTGAAGLCLMGSPERRAMGKLFWPPARARARLDFVTESCTPNLLSLATAATAKVPGESPPTGSPPRRSGCRRAPSQYWWATWMS